MTLNIETDPGFQNERKKKMDEVRLSLGGERRTYAHKKNMTFNKFSCVFLHIRHYDNMMGKKNGYSVQYR